MGYRGEIKLRYRRIINPITGGVIIKEEDTKFSHIKADFNCYEVGDKVGQIMIIPIPFIEFTEVSELSQTDRGDGGFGSTGK